MVPRFHLTGMVAAAVAVALFAHSTARAQNVVDPKQTFTIECAHKGGLSDEDREIAAKYLAENRDRLDRAPDEAIALFDAFGRVTEALASFTSPVPRRLARQMSPEAAGTIRVIFDRTLLVVSLADGRILDRVTARDEHR